MKRILINILLIILLFAIAETTCFFLTKADNDKFKKQADRLEVNNTRQFVTKYNLMSDFNTSIWRNSLINDKYHNKPFIWFGCSFAEGAGLEDNDTPCFKLSKLTERSCINKSKGATGTQFMYYQLLNNINEDVPEADFVIYTFIWNHIQRLYNYQVNPLINMFNPRYKLVNGEIKEVKPAFRILYSSYFVRRLLNKKVLKQAQQEQIDFKLFNAMMKDSVRIVKEKYPNAKFIMIEFPELSRKYLPDLEVKELESYGIIVVRVKDLIGKDIDIFDKKYWLSDDIHPKSEIWDFVLPYIAEKYMN